MSAVVTDEDLLVSHCVARSLGHCAAKTTDRDKAYHSQLCRIFAETVADARGRGEAVSLRVLNGERLYWNGSVCDHVEPVGGEADYEVGDTEPCVHCPYPRCVATVVKLDAKAKGGAR